MFVRVLSDLHKEFAKYKIKKLDEDEDTVLILAGDISVGKQHRFFVENACKNFAHVIVILGNHEFYTNEVHTIIQHWRDISDTIPNLHFLHDNSVVIDNVKFLGSTMWTDMNNDDYVIKYRAKKGMNDYAAIRFNDPADKVIRSGYISKKKVGRRLTPDDTVAMHYATTKYFDDELSTKFNGKVVIITHHLPIYSCISPRFHGNSLNFAYHAQCDWLINKHQIDYWFHGHTHDSLDFFAGDTRIICNPRGYVPHDLNPKFNDLLRIQIQ